MKYILSVLFGLLFISGTFAICTCPPVGNGKKATTAEFNDVELVFIGDVQKIDKDGLEYEIVVCEVFKGSISEGGLIKGINPKSCYPVVDKKGQWLFFGEKSDQHSFTQNECGLTNHLAEPSGEIPPPPPPASGIGYEDFKGIGKEEAKRIVKEQIEIVRQLAQ